MLKTRKMAGATRLELATSDVTGRRSNQLSYAPAGNAVRHHENRKMAGATRLELATSDVTGRRSNQLSYAPAVFCFQQKCYFSV